MTKKDLKEMILTVLNSVSEKLPKDRFLSTKELIEVGEEGVALENLCSNIDDFELDISKSDFELIQDAASRMGMDDDTWDYLARNVIK